MTQSKAVRTSGAQLVYAELKRRILELEIEPGTRLYEPGLATELQVSRTPLREAVRLLLAENLLDSLPTGGVVVPKLEAKEIAELYEVRASLESLMAAQACKVATTDDIASLEALLERNAALVHFAEDAMQVGGDIHARINTIAGNSWAIRFHEQIGNQMQRYRAYTNRTQERRDTALAEHRQLVAAIAAGDPTHARDLAFDHVLGARDEAIGAINADPA
ncbi:GntR family transcriptional regulator [uncultured Kocuria sp.]|uniref:GntR family transcriptional regulator n=1 Tax=uncultured Kocuria sp. TaxID=259305 RepID=UPI002635C83E|nr:GntR family transcriptional regulator [uncultured Kocuria sp.]